MTTADTSHEPERKWYIIDAAGKPVGETASTAVTLLLGKQKPEYHPEADCGDCVIVINARDAVMNSAKEERQYYQEQCGWVCSMQEPRVRQLMAADKPDEAISQAIRGMLPGGVLGRDIASRLKVHR